MDNEKIANELVKLAKMLLIVSGYKDTLKALEVGDKITIKWFGGDTTDGKIISVKGDKVQIQTVNVFGKPYKVDTTIDEMYKSSAFEIVKVNGKNV